MKAISMCVATIAVSTAGSARAQSAATCSFDEASATVTLTLDGLRVYLEAGDDGVIRFGKGATVPCGAATVLNTDTILVNGGDRADKAYLFGIFAPGLTPESDGASEIEIVFAPGGGQDRMQIHYSGASDIVWFTSGGIDVGNDLDEDIYLAAVEDVQILIYGGDDYVDGRSYTGGPLTVSGNGGGNKTIYGSEQDDVLYGGRNDIIVGGGGNDYLRPGWGNDQVDGGPGDDVLAQEAGPDGADFFDGGEGIDTVDYSIRYAPVFVAIGNGLADDGEAGEGDSIRASVENAIGGTVGDVLVGSAAANRLIGGDGDDELYGNDGNDRLEGGIGSDILVGDAGRDSLYGEQGPDSLSGGAGGDFLWGGPGVDTLNGGDGIDKFFGEGGADVFFNADGIAETVDCGSGAQDDAEPDPQDTFISCEL